jgi:hypothetical protein
MGNNNFYLRIVMALLKSVNTIFGIDATYWNIFSISEDFKNKSLEVVINGYVSKKVREDNLEPCAWQNLTFTGDDYIKDATRETVYLALKAKEFSDAVDA